MSVIIARPACCSLLPPVADQSVCVNGEYHSVLIPAGGSANVVLSSTSLVVGGKLLISMFNDTQTIVRTLETFAVVQGTAISDVAYGASGYRFNTTTVLEVVAGNMQASFTNNEAYDINIVVVFIPVPLDAIVPPTDLIPFTTNQTLINPISTACVDVIQTSWVGATWNVSVTDGTNRTSFQVSTNTQTANMYAIVGSTTNIDVTIVVVGNFIGLMLSNNGANTLHAVATRLPIPSVMIPSQACGEGSTSPAHVTPSQIIQPAQTLLVDAVDVGVISSKWMVVVTNLSTYKVNAFELNADLTSLTYVQYAMIGERQPTSISLASGVGQTELHITNNGATAVRINILRLPVSI